MKEFTKLVDVIARLRHPTEGCPWDLKQTHQSLLKFLVEECYEYLDATELQDTNKMEEELGDVLLQILLHCKIAEEKGSFDLESVSKTLREKLIRRHPHVFKDKDTSLSPDDVVTKWNEIKKDEKKDIPTSHIDKSYLKFPGLFSAYKIGKKTKQIKFDWENAEEVKDVVESEWQELQKELKSGNKEKIEEEMGDLLFSMAQLARHLKLEPEETLRLANQKFLRRFQAMEKLIAQDNVDLESLNQKEMDVYWDKVKKNEA